MLDGLKDGAVSASSAEAVNGKTLYAEVRPADGACVKAANLSALDR